MGSSMGSAVSVLKAADTPDKFKSLILIATPLDLISIFPGMTKEKAILLDPEKTSSISGIEISNRFFMEISALDMVQAVKKINCPVLLIHGQKDSTVDFKNFNIFTVNLSTDYKSLIIEDGDHNLTRDEDITAISRCIIKWLEGFNA